MIFSSGRRCEWLSSAAVAPTLCFDFLFSLLYFTLLLLCVTFGPCHRISSGIYYLSSCPLISSSTHGIATSARSRGRSRTAPQSRRTNGKARRALSAAKSSSSSKSSRRPTWDSTNHDLSVYKLSSREQARRRRALESPHNILLRATGKAVSEAVEAAASASSADISSSSVLAAAAAGNALATPMPYGRGDAADSVTPVDSRALRLRVAEAYAEADRRRLVAGGGR